MVRVLIKSYGCSASMNDGEIMAGLLEKAGHKIVYKPEAADVIIINTCIVKGRTESRMRNIISKLSRGFPKKRLIIAGCMPQVGMRLPVKNASIIGPHNILEIVEVVSGKKKRAVGRKALVKAGIPKKSSNKYVNIVQILEGCSGYCAYCIVKQAKPILCSFPEDSIVEEIRAGLRRGAHEVWLTSQDNASYQAEKKRKSCLPVLLRQIGNIDGRFLVRIGMMNPDTILPVLDELIEAYKSPKVFKFLHIPVQSGNDRILGLMNRKYSVEDFKQIITKFRKAIPDITISTDIIVGFPSETEAEFEDSIKLLRWLKPDVLNFSRFFPRPNTPAAAMKGQVQGSITKTRSEDMAKLFGRLSTEKNLKWLGWKGEVYVDKKGKPGTFIGRNHAYKPVVVASKENLLGRQVVVEIAEARKNYLIGKIVQQKRL
jgi:threonylcarbamoyladenosine tRNA methylthiotransferase CDKAL1